MTREEAIFCEKSYIGETNCVDCKYYGTDTCQSRESHKMAIKALERNTSFINKPCISIGVCHEDKIKVLDKIRAEIETYRSGDFHSDDIMMKREILQIIDKYREEEE